jgi:hypothetical protein
MKTYTKSWLAARYKVHRNTISAYLAKNSRLRHLRGRKRLYKSDIDLIYEVLGPP